MRLAAGSHGFNGGGCVIVRSAPRGWSIVHEIRGARRDVKHTGWFFRGSRVNAVVSVWDHGFYGYRCIGEECVSVDPFFLKGSSTGTSL